MIPVLTPADVKAIDERALADQSIESILERVGLVVADEALLMLASAGTTDNAQVIVIAGPGLNGADARSAAKVLSSRGVSVDVLDAMALASEPIHADLIIDGAFGIGLTRPWTAPDVGDTPVLAIDIPSGIEGSTGQALGSPLHATRTITLGGYKAGLLFGDGPDFASEIVVADIGLGTAPCRAHVMEPSELAALLPQRSRTAHKWQSALLVVAGSPGMTGAARLCTGAAMRAGSGYVHLATTADPDPGLPVEVVSSSATDAMPEFDRFSAAVIGPGLGTGPALGQVVGTLLKTFAGPVVIDGDGLTAVAGAPEMVTKRSGPTVLTPHDGEYERLAGHPPGSDRITAARELAVNMQAIVLLKGPATVIANPDGEVRINLIGDQRLATAGTGDVLAGIIGALLAQGVDPFDAASAGAYIHGAAATLGPHIGLIASDLVPLIPAALAEVARQRP